MLRRNYRQTLRFRPRGLLKGLRSRFTSAPAAPEWQAKFANALSFQKDFGGRTDGSDNAAAFNSIPAGSIVVVESGFYTLLSAWNLVSGLQVWFKPGARLYMPFVTTGVAGAISQAAIGTPLEGVRLYGGEFTKVSHDNAGRVFSVNINDFHCQDFKIDTFGNGGAFFISGNRVVLNNGRITNPKRSTGVAGIRPVSGSNHRYRNLYVEAGDGALQIAPAVTGVLGNLDCSDIQYDHCSGWASDASFILVGLVNQQGVGGLTNSITNFRFSRIKGESGSRAILIDNQDSTGSISGGVLSDIDITCLANQPSNSKVVFRGSLGPCRDIKTKNVKVRSANNLLITKSGAFIDANSIDTSGVTISA